jgi:hypothetical protein
MSGIRTVTGTVVNITHNGDNNINLDDDEFDDLLNAVTKSAVMSPDRKATYARLEFLERKNAARNADMKKARNGRQGPFVRKQSKLNPIPKWILASNYSALFIYMSKRCEQAARNFYAATTQM